jgi:hypothetical protein
VYIFYEEITDVCLIVLSQDGYTTILFRKRQSEQDKINLGMILSLLKSVPLENRDFNDITKIWTILGPKGKVVIAQLESMILQGLFSNVEIRRIQDLEEKALKGWLNRNRADTKEQKFSTEDFFYSPVASPQLSGVALAEKLAPLLSLSPSDLASKEMNEKTLKKHYLRAALRLHPDRNNGDNSMMSELNMLWGIYNSK